MTTSKWYERRPIASSVLACIGADPDLFNSLSAKAHVDDMEDIAAYLGVPDRILTEVLYKPCEDPGGFNGRLS